LWEDSVEVLFGHRDALSPITAYWEKRHLDVRNSGFRFETRALPISNIYILADRAEESRLPIVEPLNLREAALGLTANAFGSYLLDGKRRVEEFLQVTRLVQEVPVRLVKPHSDIATLGQLRDVILRDQRASHRP
ncbi:MAG: HPr kinase, partial [Bryobacterales bacterium]|nr:HPr kinase [Bryobacterales bacterium]